MKSLLRYLAALSQLLSFVSLILLVVPLTAQVNISQWNFNSVPPDANVSTGTLIPNIGAGTASLVGGATATFASGDANNASTDPATGDDSGWNITTFAAQGTGNKTRGVQFLVSTVGYENIQVRWDQRHSNTAPRHVQFQYTTNGSTWVDFGALFVGSSGDFWFNNRTVNLSSITAANNNPNFGFRIVAAFDPVPGTSYTASNTGSTYGTGGTWRFDMVTVLGTLPNNPPTIVLDVTATTNFLDGGAPVNIPSPYSISGVISDPTDPAAIYGVDFLIGDSDNPIGDLTVSATSSNAAVVPNANLVLTGTGANRNLKITPIGVGFATITVAVSDGASTTNYILNYAASPASVNPATSRFHTGVACGSTAVAIDNDYMFVADDEDQVLRLFRRDASGLAVNGFDMSSSLGLVPPSQGVDIESSTRIGNTIYWMGSHSNRADGADRPNRERIFATTLSGSGSSTTLTYAGRYDFLEDDLVAWDASNGHGLGANFFGLAASSAGGVPPEGDNGFNIEGLTIAPNGTTAYIGLRAPIVPAASRTKALLIQVNNFASLLTPGGGTPGSAQFGAPVQFDLCGLGIRSIERNSANEYLIIAGPAGAPANPLFKLYSWTGNPADAPKPINTDLAALMTGGSFEGIVEVPAPLTGSTVQLIVDNGATDIYQNGVLGGDIGVSNFKKFRSEIVTLGPVLSVNAGTYGPACSVNGLVALNGTPAGGTFSGVGVSGSNFDPSAGTQTITYTVQDADGCTFTATTTIQVADGLPLSITCPSTVPNLTANSRCRATLGDYTGLAETIGGCGGTLSPIVQTPAPGTIVNPGRVAIRLTASNDLGEEATCIFNVTISGSCSGK